MLKLKLQYFGHLTRRVDSLENILMLGGIGGRRRRGRQRMRWLDGITNSMGMGLGVGGGQGGLVCCDSWGRKESDTTEWLNWTVYEGFLGSLAGKESACNVGDLGSIPGSGRLPGGRHGNPLQYSCLENPHGQKSLVGYSPWGHKESDMTEWLSTAQHNSLWLVWL